MQAKDRAMSAPPERATVAEYYRRMTDDQQEIMRRFQAGIRRMEERHAKETAELAAAYRAEMAAFEERANSGLLNMASDPAIAAENLRYQKEVMERVENAIKDSSRGPTTQAVNAASDSELCD
jgi:hypothetical protein